jgi:hypothetical protein
MAISCTREATEKRNDAVDAEHGQQHRGLCKTGDDDGIEAAGLRSGR